MLIVPVAFVSEHVETLVELDRDYAELAREKGCPYYLRVPAVGIEQAFVEELAELVRGSLGRLGCAPGASACDAGLRRCPYSQHRPAG